MTPMLHQAEAMIIKREGNGEFSFPIAHKIPRRGWQEGVNHKEVWFEDTLMFLLAYGRVLCIALSSAIQRAPRKVWSA